MRLVSVVGLVLRGSLGLRAGRRSDRSSRTPGIS